MRPIRSRTAASPSWQLVHFNISQLTLDAVKPFGLGNKEALRCKNMWTLGLALWMFDRDRAADRRLAQGQVRQGARAGRSQYRRAERRPCLWRDRRDRRPGPRSITSTAAPAEPGLYRTVTGAESLSLGLVAGAQLAGLPMFFGGYPITPASRDPPPSSRLKEYGITTFQAEDEIAAICAAIGASYAGQLGVTSSSGPGHRAQERGDGPRDHDRAAAGHRQFAARRARRPAFRPRPSSPTSTRRSMAATATRRCR